MNNHFNYHRVLFSLLRFPHAVAEAGFGALLLSSQAPACIQGRGIGPDRSDLAAHSSLVTAIRRDYRWNRFSLSWTRKEEEEETGERGWETSGNTEGCRWWGVCSRCRRGKTGRGDLELEEEFVFRGIDEPVALARLSCEPGQRWLSSDNSFINRQ